VRVKSQPFGSVDRELRKLERRNGWMWGLTALLLILQGLAIVLLFLPELQQHANPSVLPETRGILATSLFGLTVLFCLYVFDKQLEIRRLRSALAGERVHLESVRSRLSELSALFEVAAHLNTRLAPRAYREAVMDRLVAVTRWWEETMAWPPAPRPGSGRESPGGSRSIGNRSSWNGRSSSPVSPEYSSPIPRSCRWFAYR
jgi:hypothetical protein